MKLLPGSKTVAALAFALVAAAAVSQVQPQPQPPPQPLSAPDGALPADILPGSPLADVLKMIQAGVDTSTIKSYILNSQSAFNLDADKILYLKDAGAPTDIINAMMDRDKALYAATVTPPPVSAPPLEAAPPVDASAPVAPDMAPPPTEVTTDYFNDALAPYGSWVEVEGYGQCWRPTTVIYDAGWTPYCDRGHWVNTDYGWYWDSDYAWGLTFHYGRWFRSPRWGWCWYPDTVWAPSWVVWRSSDDLCGWAPLPPFAVFRPGAGFFYRGARVGLDFDFGLGADVFVFVSPDHFGDRHPRSFRVAPQRVAQIFHQTTIVNHYDVNNRTIVNRGIGVERIASATHRPVETVRVSALPNAGRQGWRGEGSERTLQPVTPNRNFNPGGGPAGNNQLRHGPEILHPDGPVPIQHREDPVLPRPGWQPGGAVPAHYPPPAPQAPQSPRPNNNFGDSRVSTQNPPQPRQFVPPSQPRPEFRPAPGEAPARNFSPPAAPPPAAPTPPPERNTGGGSNGGANNGNNNNNNGSNKQNH